MITLKRYIGQWGNQLCQAAVCKILADRTGLPWTPPSGWLTKSGKPLHWAGAPIVEVEGTPGVQHKGKRHHLHFDHWCDLAQFGPECGEITINHCYAQRYEMFQPYRDMIRNCWLKIRVPLLDPDPEAVYCHVRRTDYVPGVDNPNDPARHCLAATLDDYRECLAEFPDAKRLVVATDDPADPFIADMRTLGLPLEVLGGTWDTDWLALASARWLIMPQSTYSWWAGFLGRAERIVCPIRAGTHWWYGRVIRGPSAIGHDYPNLYVYDEPHRWIWKELP